MNDSIGCRKDVSEELSQKRVASPLERSRQKKMSNRKSSKSLSKELVVTEKKIVSCPILFVSPQVEIRCRLTKTEILNLSIC